MSVLAGARGAIVAVSIFLALGMTGQQAPEQKPPDKKPVKRVRVNLAGFELAPQPPAQSSTQLGGGTRTLAGGDPAPLAPSTGRSYTGAPVLVWRHASQAQKFDVRILDEKGTVVHRASVTGRHYHYPADAPQLAPGATYRWTVQPQASMLGGTSPQATIVRLPADEIAAVSEQLAHPTAGINDAEWRAQVFTDRRLWYDAVAAWTALIEKFPARADLREKRGQVYDQLPVTQELADEDFAAAERLRAAGR